jgi:Domain of unknown function (DUF4402)
MGFTHYSKILFQGIVLAAMIFGASTSAVAAPQSTEAQAVIVTPLSFFKVDDLIFGRILPSATAGTVTVDPTGVRTKTGGVTLFNGGGEQPSRFAGRGAPGQIVAISLTSTPNVLTRVGGTQTMALSTFVIGSTPTVVLTGTNQFFQINNTSGIFNFPVGATLAVGANQMAGNYAGTFVVTLNYQ